MQEHRHDRYRYFNGKYLLNLFQQTRYPIAGLYSTYHDTLTGSLKNKVLSGHGRLLNMSIMYYTTFNVNKNLQVLLHCLVILQYPYIHSNRHTHPHTHTHTILSIMRFPIKTLSKYYPLDVLPLCPAV